MIVYKMINNENGEIKYYLKQKTMCKKHGFKDNMVRAVIGGYRKSHHGHKFERLDIEDINSIKIEDLPNNHNNNKNNIQDTKYKSVTEIKDGIYKSDKLLNMSEEESKDKAFLLKAHGFDDKFWELISARNSIWNMYSKKEGMQELYSSKITVKPKACEFDLDWFKEQFKEIESIDIFEYFEGLDKDIKTDEDKVVELQFADLHIGLNGIDYEEKLKSIAKNIIDKHKDAKQFMFPIGQDWLNADIQIGADFKTTKGTSLQQRLSYENMIKTGIRVATFIIDYILLNTNATIDCIYIPANHDKHSTYGVFQAVKQRYYNFQTDVFENSINFDDGMQPRKYRKIGVSGIMLAHGDKERNKIYECFQIEAPLIYANTKFREAHLSHLHNESVVVKNGIIFRRLPTVNAPDDWHVQNGYVGATHRIQVFVYNEKYGLNSIEYYYID